jgi:hypothetical protein
MAQIGYVGLGQVVADRVVHCGLLVEYLVTPGLDGRRCRH